MKFRFALVLGPAAALVLARCVGGDDSSVKDGGNDATQNDVTAQPPDSGGDVVSTPDAEAGIGPAPTPDGGVVWLNHYNSNAGFNDIVVNENGGLTYVIGGGMQTDPGAGNQFHFGTSITLGPSVASTDVFVGQLSDTGSAIWGKTAPTTVTSGNSLLVNVDTYNAVAVDSAGNVYAFGFSRSGSISPKDTLPGPTSYLVKLSSAGVAQWEHPYSFGAGTLTTPVSLAVSGSTVYIALTYYQSITYDTNKTFNTNGGSGEDAFVTALDTANGNTKWAESFGSTAYDSVSGMATTPNGGIVIAGTMNGTMTGLTGPGFPVQQISDGGTENDAYVVKLDANGAPVYSATFGNASSNTYAAGVAYLNGVVALAGSFYGNVDFGKGTFTSQSTDGFVLTWDETAKKTTFASHLGGSAADYFTSVALDPWGEVVATGTYGATNAAGQLDTKALPQTSISVGGMVLAKWDAAGNALWSHAYTPTLNGGAPPYTTADAANGYQSVVGARVQTTSTGLIILTGWMQGGADFGQGYQSLLSTIQPQFKCGGVITCEQSNTCKYCPGTPIDGLVGTWRP